METHPSKPKVLIVDDIPANIDILWRSLKSEYKVSFAMNGLDALKLASSRRPPNLILLDIMMDGMDGYEVCRRLKAQEHTRQIPIIFITAMSGEQDEAMGLKLGAVDYIRKPFSLAIVKARVRTHLELGRHRDRLEDLVKMRTAELTATNEQLRREIDGRQRAEDALKKAHDDLELRVKERTAELLDLLEKQEINIGLARGVLGLINGFPSRYVDLPGGVKLFTEVLSLPCHAEGGDHCFVRHWKRGALNGADTTVMSLKDQSGHEVSCVLRSIITDLLHNAVMNNNSHIALEETIGLLNDAICRSGLFHKDDFFTSMTAELDHETLVFRYVSTGHPPMLLIREGEVLELPGPDGGGDNLPIGIRGGLEFLAGERPLQAGDRIIMYTDGLNEMPLKNRNEVISLPMLKGMVEEILVRDRLLPVSEMARELLSRIAAWSGEEVVPYAKNTSADDVTMLCLEIEDGRLYREWVCRPRRAEHIAKFVEELYGEMEKEWNHRSFEDPSPRLRLVLEEAILNGWVHGNRRDPEKALTVRVRWGNDMHLEILDQGEGFDCGNVPDPTTEANLTKLTGRGIFIIRHYASSAVWEGNGRRLVASFKKRLNPVEEDAAVRAGRLMRLWGQVPAQD